VLLSVVVAFRPPHVLLESFENLNGKGRPNHVLGRSRVLLLLDLPDADDLELEHELLLQGLLAALHDVLEGCREFQLHFEHVRGRQGQILAVLEGLNCETPNQRVRVGELLDFCCVDEIHI
jgi:hypothetical protein